MGFDTEFPHVLTLKEIEKITFIGNVPYKSDGNRAQIIAKSKAYKTFKISVEIYWSPTFPPRKNEKDN